MNYILKNLKDDEHIQLIWDYDEVSDTATCIISNEAGGDDKLPDVIVELRNKNWPGLVIDGDNTSGYRLSISEFTSFIKENEIEILRYEERVAPLKEGDVLSVSNKQDVIFSASSESDRGSMHSLKPRFFSPAASSSPVRSVSFSKLSKKGIVHLEYSLTLLAVLDYGQDQSVRRETLAHLDGSFSKVLRSELVEFQQFPLYTLSSFKKKAIAEINLKLYEDKEKMMLKFNNLFDTTINPLCQKVLLTIPKTKRLSVSTELSSYFKQAIIDIIKVTLEYNESFDEWKERALKEILVKLTVLMSDKPPIDELPTCSPALLAYLVHLQSLIKNDAGITKRMNKCIREIRESMLHMGRIEDEKRVFLQNKRALAQKIKVENGRLLKEIVKKALRSGNVREDIDIIASNTVTAVRKEIAHLIQAILDQNLGGFGDIPGKKLGESEGSYFEEEKKKLSSYVQRVSGSDDLYLFIPGLKQIPKAISHFVKEGAGLKNEVQQSEFIADVVALMKDTIGALLKTQFADALHASPHMHRRLASSSLPVGLPETHAASSVAPEEDEEPSSTFKPQ